MKRVEKPGIVDGSRNGRQTSKRRTIGATVQESPMPRYVVERTFPQGLEIPINDEGVAASMAVVDRNADHGVTWVHSYVSEDKKCTYCVYDGPSPEAIRQAASCTGLPVDRITRVSVLDPYFYR
jgi:hypothetical protein